LNIEVSAVCGVLAALGILIPANDIAAQALISPNVPQTQPAVILKNKKNSSFNGDGSLISGNIPREDAIEVDKVGCCLLFFICYFSSVQLNFIHIHIKIYI
jgi:hypothetical protein